MSGGAAGPPGEAGPPGDRNIGAAQISKEGRIAERVMETLAEKRIAESEKVSNNAKTIILGSFVLVGFLTSMFILTSI